MSSRASTTLASPPIPPFAWKLLSLLAAAQMANDTTYGLVAGLWTRDVSRAHRVAAQLQAGMVSVNTFRPVHWTLPYGGYKSSGLGRENGLAVLREYAEIKSVVIDYSDAEPDDPFAEPAPAEANGRPS